MSLEQNRNFIIITGNTSHSPKTLNKDKIFVFCGYDKNAQKCYVAIENPSDITVTPKEFLNLSQKTAMTKGERLGITKAFNLYAQEHNESMELTKEPLDDYDY